MGTDSSGVNMYFISFADYFSLFFPFRYIGVGIFFQLIEFDRSIFNQICRYGLCIMWFPNGGVIKDQLHLIASDVEYLCCLCQFRTGRKITVLRDLVIGDHIFGIWLTCVSTGYTKVTDRIISRNTVKYFQILDIPFYNFRRNEEGGVCISFAIKLCMQGSEAWFLHFTVKSCLVFDNRDAVVISIEGFVGNRFLDLCERKYGQQRCQ